MLMYLEPADAQKYYDEFVRRLSEFMGAVRNPAILAECVTISRCCLQRDYYKALLSCRKLIEYEDVRLGNVPAGVSAGGDEG
jgi:flagellar protein FlbT